jgi:anthraniloyl-CoA monooxygenase
MDTVAAAFARGAERAAAAGFDLLELSFAQGYLLASFLSPLANNRSDDWGGSIENRMRFPLMVFDAVRDVWPADRPLAVALSVTDWVPYGLSLEDSVTVARTLVVRGCDAIEVMAGQATADAVSVYDPTALIQLSDRVRNEAQVATLATGGIRLADDVNNLVASGRADLCFIDPPSVNAHLRPVRCSERPPAATQMEVAEVAHA